MNYTSQLIIMIKHNLSFCQLELHDNYAVAVMNEGIVVDKENNAILVDIAKKHFQNTPFVYITNRINSYSVDPIIYINTAKVKSLKGFAIVSKDPIQKAHAKYEKTFFSKEFKQFDTLKAALKWKDDILEKYKD